MLLQKLKGDVEFKFDWVKMREERKKLEEEERKQKNIKSEEILPDEDV